MRIHRLGVYVPVLFLLGTILTWAQSGTTSLHGVVSDAKGAVLPGAAVTLRDPQTGFTRTVQTASDGTYQFLQIQPSTYTLEVSATGFATLKREDVRLQVNTPATINFTMQVAGTRVEVEVTSEAPLVNTQDASIGNAFNTRQLVDLPSEGRDPVSILSLQPGVTYIGSQVDQTNDSRGGAVAGARSDQTNITWDGLDNNDQLSGNAFAGALRSTLDSLQEFRVTTNSGNADEGRSSGAQVSLVTKSGTNSFHGSLYEYNRNNVGEANDWFNKAAQISTGQPNKAPQLIRNTFGATIGGPIEKDRLFFFLAYEGQRTRETTQVTRVIPSEAFRQGILQYLCTGGGVDPSCVPNTPGPGNPNPFTVVGNPADQQLLVQLTSAQFANMDPNCANNTPPTCPLGPGVNPLVANLNGTNPSAVFENYPTPNTLTGGGDLLNLQGFTFPGATPFKHDTYIVRLDYKLTANGNHSLFVRGNLQNDHGADFLSEAPQFPGQPPNQLDTDNSKGIAVGYTALLRSNLINNFRYAFVRQGLGIAGANSQNYVHFRTVDDTAGFAYQSTFTNVPVHNFVDDLSWTKGGHTLQFGTNLRLIRNNRAGNDHNVSYAVTDPFSLGFSGIAGSGTSLDPSVFTDPTTGTPYPIVDANFAESYDFAATALAGLVTVSNVTFNQDKAGTVFAPGALITRHFKSWEAEWYLQDAWRVTPNLVITAGLRYSLLQPPYEASGNQAAPNISMGDFFAKRALAMENGQVYSPEVQFVLSGQANGKKPYWNWDYKDIAPRLALAYSPHADGGWLHTLFGGAGKSSIRAGYGIFYDHFGQGIVNTFDRNGSFGLTTTETNPYGIQEPECAARFAGLHSLPQGTFCGQDMTGTPPGGFPVTPPSGVDMPGGFAIYWGMDDRLKTPYSHVLDFSVTRELGRNFSLEVSYVGRLGHHLLQETDLAMPTNVRDPKSGMDYFTAATIFAKLAYSGVDPTDPSTPPIAPIPYWENLFPVPAGSQMTATQQMYLSYWNNLGNEVVALQAFDTACDPLCSQLPGQSQPTKYNFYNPQFSSLWGWRSAGNSSYNALNLSLRHALSHGLQFDVNYSYSKSIDVGSNAERINVFDTNGTNNGGFSSQVINAWAPNQGRSVSDFDMKHQINSNWIVDLPVGRGKRFGSGMGRLADAFLGGWSFSGLFHWTTGLPFSIFPAGWSTNYNLTGEAILVGNPGKVGVYRDVNGNPNMFKDVNAAVGAFRHPYPGETGERNNLRGQGYFGIDTGLGKEWQITEQQHIKFHWEVFNLTNAVRFDAALSSNNFDLSSAGFGVYSSPTLTKPRVMQFSLRYSF